MVELEGQSGRTVRKQGCLSGHAMAEGDQLRRRRGFFCLTGGVLLAEAVIHWFSLIDKYGIMTGHIYLITV